MIASIYLVLLSLREVDDRVWIWLLFRTLAQPEIEEEKG